MNKHLRRQFITEVSEGRSMYMLKRYDDALYYFERAHVLGQYYAFSHSLVHWWMLKIALRTINLKDIVIQFLFIIIGFLGSMVGLVVRPNYGRVGKTVNKWPVPYELLKFIKEDHES